MFIKQLSIFLGNRKGSLHEVTKVLADNNINLLTVSIADTKDFGLLRLIADDNARAANALKMAGFSVTESDLIGIEVADAPGGMNGVLKILEKADISVEYLYSYTHAANACAVILMRVKDTQKAYDILTQNKVKLIDKLKQ